MKNAKRVVLSVVFSIWLIGIGNLFAGVSLDYPIPYQDYIPGSHDCRKFLDPADHLGDDVNSFGSCPPPPNKAVEYAKFDGSPVKAIGDGKIVWYSSASGYGELVAVIEHDLGQEVDFTNGNGTTTKTRYLLSIYGHIRKNQDRGDGNPLGWQVGNEVKKGQIIGYINDHDDDDDDDDHNGEGEGTTGVHLAKRYTNNGTMSQGRLK